jgi:hypothetical protein
MNELERELSDALRRERPPAGFVERVLRRAAAVQPQHSRRWHPYARWAAAAALVAAVAGGVHYRVVQERAERARGEAAKEQVIEALRIAGAKLQLVQSKIKGIGS